MSEDNGLFYKAKSLDNYSFLFVLERIINQATDPEVVDEVKEIEQLYGIDEFPHGKISAYRTFFIVESIYSDLIETWKDWTVNPNN